MKVTPRLPLHGSFTHCIGLKELRYFRLHDESKVAAILFGLLEEANFPQSKRLRKKLIELSSCSESEDRKLLDFVLDPLVPQQTLLSVWNYEAQFYFHLKRLFRDLFAQFTSTDEDFLSSLQRELKFEAVNCCELPNPSPGAISIIWGESNDGAVLLYRHYAVNSIVITPCRHAYIKWSLFEQLRHAMGRPMTREELKEKSCNCRCGEDIADMVFTKGRDEAEPLSRETALAVYRDILSEDGILTKYREKTLSVCCCCENASGINVCNSRHRMCLKCLASNTITRHQFRCVRCQEKVPAYLKDEIMEQIPPVTSMEIEQITIMCDGCRVEVPFREFTDSWNSSHSCLLCRSCITGCEGRCPSCNELLLLSIKPARLVKSDSAKHLKCEQCLSQGEIADFGACMASVHKCLICDTCVLHSKQYEDDNCPKCHDSCAFSDISNRGKSKEYMQIRCQECFLTKTSAEFSQASLLSHWFRCRICDVCQNSKFKSNPPICCPNCSREYSDEDLIILRSKRQNLIGGIKAKSDDRNTSMICAKCQMPKPLRDFLIGDHMSQQRLVCNECKSSSPDLSRSDSRKICRCSNLISENEFPRCPMKCACSTCLTTHFNLRKDRYCPNCQQEIRGLPTQQGQKAANGPQYLEFKECLLCHKLCEPKELSVYRELNHKCRICDICYFKQTTQYDGKCLLCKDTFDAVMELNYYHAVRKLTSDLSRKLCDCGNNITQNAAPRCQNMCKCSVCLAKHFLLTDLPQCPVCQMPISAIRISPYCSSCSRPLNAHSTNALKTVNGICSKLHVLCCFCINVESLRTYCKLCGESVECKSVTDVQLAQREFRLACFCGEYSPYSEIRNLLCGHQVHLSCINSVFFCRICQKEVKSRPAPRTLGNFVE